MFASAAAFIFLLNTYLRVAYQHIYCLYAHTRTKARTQSYVFTVAVHKARKIIYVHRSDASASPFHDSVQNTYT